MTYSIKEIEQILKLFYVFNYKITKINKESNVSVAKIKYIIKIYGPIYEEKYPQYKKTKVITIDEFKKYLNNNKSPSDVHIDNESSFMEETNK